MKVNPTIALTLILLSLIVGAGVVSASWGYALGREALKGIRQPDVRPVSNVGQSSQSSTPRREALTLLSEEEILSDVKARMEGNARDEDTPDQNSQSRVLDELPSDTATASLVSTNSSISSDPPQVGLPIAAEDQSVTLELHSARSEDGTLQFDVSLQNNSSRSFQFLYSFMNVTDDQGRTFSANAQGLPTELPPDGELYSGVISIPSALLDESNALSLELTDYPNQRLQLKLSGIPVVR